MNEGENKNISVRILHFTLHLMYSESKLCLGMFYPHVHPDYRYWAYRDTLSYIF